MIAVVLESGNNRTIYRQVSEFFKLKGISCLTARSACCDYADVLVAGEGVRTTNIKSPILIAPGDAAASLSKKCGAKTLITYGYKDRDTLTLSSALHKGGMAALQREVVGLNGIVTEPKEIDLSPYNGTIPEKMAVSAAMMILGKQFE